MFEHICENCQKPFRHKREFKVYCCKKCFIEGIKISLKHKRKHFREEAINYKPSKRECFFCGNFYEPNLQKMSKRHPERKPMISNPKFCSRRCSRKFGNLYYKLPSLMLVEETDKMKELQRIKKLVILIWDGINWSRTA